MSYQQFQERCDDCGKEWNAAFGIVGTTQIAAPPEKCPYCQSERKSFITYGWALEAPTGQPARAWTQQEKDELRKVFETTDISTPRPTDCADIREGRLVVLSRFDCPEDPELDGKPSMTMRYIGTQEDKKDG